MPTLRLVSTTGATIEVERDSVAGRDPGCEIVITDSSVSRRHARIELRGTGWWVVDQGSANGTFVDSQRVPECELRSGQELRFGAVGHRVEIEGQGGDLDATVIGAPPDEKVTVLATAAMPVTPAPSVPSYEPPAYSPPPPAPPPGYGAPSFAAREMGSGPQSAPVPQMAAPPAPAARKGPWLWIGVGCCGCLLMAAVVIAAAIGIPVMMSQAPVSAAREQLQLVQSGQLEQAYTNMAESYRAQVGFQDFEALVAQHPGLNDFKETTFNQRSLANDTATLSGMLHSKSGQTEPVTIVLRKENDAWRIAELRFADF